MVCSSCSSANEIINASLQRKLQKRTVNRTCGVEITDVPGGPSGWNQFASRQRGELTRVGCQGDIRRFSGIFHQHGL